MAYSALDRSLYGCVVERQLDRQRVRDKRLHTGRNVDKPAGAIHREITGTHVILGSDGIDDVILD